MQVNLKNADLKHLSCLVDPLQYYHRCKKDVPNFKEYVKNNNISCDKDYNNILRAGIKRPRVFDKRQPSEKWHNPFNPFVFNIVRSNMDIQFITEEYSCANYVAEYVNKTNQPLVIYNDKLLKL